MLTNPQLAGALHALPPGCTFKTICKVAPLGSLQARRQRDGIIVFAWRFSVTVGGVERESREQFGRFDAKLPPKSLKPTGDRYSLAAAIRKAEALAEAHCARRRDGGMLAIREAERAAREQQDAEARADRALTLSALMADYCAYLEGLGRESVSDVRSLVRTHIDPSDIAHKPARLVEPEDVADLMRAINESGKTRTANKARSFIRAAYEVAKSARVDASIPAKFKEYKIRTNPAAETRVIKNGKRPVIRALTLVQLRKYWALIRDMPGVQGAMLRVHLLTGGQRLDQLVRLAPADVGADSFTLFDGKGKPGEGPRPHVVPLIPAAAAALAESMTTSGAYAFTSNGGKSHIRGETLSGWAIEAARGEIPGFQAKMIRSGIETALAAAGIDKETRGRLQSHGIGGVQDRHYNAHDYMNEKRRALDLFYQLLSKGHFSP